MTNAVDRRYPSKPDYWILAVVALLVLFGLAAVYSASQGEVPEDPSYYLRRQLMWVALGTVVLVLATRFDYRRLQFYSLLALVGTTLLMLAVLIFRDDSFGASRWLGGLIGRQGSIQPSELMKIVVVLYVAYWLSTKGSEIRHATYGLVPFSLLVGGVSALILRQPDFSTAVVLAAVCMAMFFIAGAVVWQLVAVGAIGLVFAALLIVTADYRLDRVESFQQAFINPLKAAYHVRQTVLTLSSGGFAGRGLGNGILKFGWLPLAHTDSIYAVVGEEMGFLGCGAILALFGVLAWRGYRTAAQAQDSFGSFLAAGLTTLLVLQALVNIGVTTASIPFTGVTLPFVSYGGSSMVVSLLAAGILFNISGHRVEEE